MSQLAGARRARSVSVVATGILLAAVLLAAGCTTLEEWVHNGFKVGPNFHRPPAPVANKWIDSGDPHLLPGPLDEAWWHAFKDPALDTLIAEAYEQNLDLKQAVTRVLQARAQRNIAAGNLFPQSQNALGSYTHAQISQNIFPPPNPGPSTLPFGIPNPFSSSQIGLPNTLSLWTTGFNASWELDFWGHIRRNIESANDQLKASIDNYRGTLVTLLGDVATAYVQIRTYQQRIVYARQNLEAQRGSLRIAQARLKAGSGLALDVEQARSNVAQTEASIPPLEIGLRQANNRLRVLLGEPPAAIIPCLGEAPIPVPPPEVAVGIPAELLERRPDVRAALATAAAQAAQVGVAEAAFYPTIGVNGFIGYVADDLSKLFEPKSFTGFIMPNFQWQVLNYGRVLNNVRYQEALLQQRILQYQQTVLTAGREVEDGLVAFIQYQLQARSLEESVRATERSVELVLAQYRAGRADFNRVYTTQALLATQQDLLAASRGNIAVSLIGVYRAMGGGWRVFDKSPPPAICAGPPAHPGGPPSEATPDTKPDTKSETLPTPRKEEKEDDQE
jgi:NodT family efflux transporter outer membrane factor (OMF) lipoprotein